MPHFESKGGEQYTQAANHRLRVPKNVYQQLWGRGVETGWRGDKMRPVVLTSDVDQPGGAPLKAGTWIMMSMNEKLRVVPAPEMAEKMKDIVKAVKDARDKGWLPEVTEHDRQMLEEMRKYGDQERVQHISSASCDAILLELVEAVWMGDLEKIAIAERLGKLEKEQEAMSPVAKGGEAAKEDEPLGKRKAREMQAR